MSGEPSMRLARELRRAIKERSARLDVAVELFDTALTPLERLESATVLLEAVTDADLAYERAKANAVDVLAQEEHGS